MEKTLLLKKDEDLNDDEYLEITRKLLKELIDSGAFKVFYID